MTRARPRRLPRSLATLAAAACALVAPRAGAFCGFYVSGADAKLFNDATQVALMREGTRTVLSMQNAYQGPPQDFAMVVPVPVVLQKENVKTLPRAVFEHLDQLDAPRLVEYWEQDPCAQPEDEEDAPMKSAEGAAPGAARGVEKEKDLGVTIEAQFTVGEYEIVILGAKDSAGLDTWLRREGYKIPAGAEPYLRPYVAAGSKFFVARVDAKKVRFEGGRATLSPLRFHYDAEQFALPIRLGLVNSSGTQDLIVHVLARGQRYEAANYPNATIPTNFDVAEAARGRFGAFYAALYDRTLEKNPKAVVTEYSWDASSCDPCPTPPLDSGELATLGADVLTGAPSEDAAPRSKRRRWGGGFVLTRLHARYAKDGLGEDLVFRTAPPIAGGREVRGSDGSLEHGAVSSPVNNFQGRYAIRHPWTGPITCPNPVRGIWGGPPGGVDEARIQPALGLATAPRGGLELASFVKERVPELDLVPGVPAAPIAAAPASTSPATTPAAAKRGGCAGCTTGAEPGSTAGALSALGLALAAVARRRRRG